MVQSQITVKEKSFFQETSQTQRKIECRLWKQSQGLTIQSYQCQIKNVYSRLENGTENISPLHERLVQVSDYLSRWMLSLYKETREHYNFKEHLYRFQIHMHANNFIKARDKMKDAHIHVLTYAYTEYTLLVEKSIRALPDASIKDNSSRLCLFQSLKDRIDSKIEIIDKVMENYTTLYSRGENSSRTSSQQPHVLILKCHTFIALNMTRDCRIFKQKKCFLW